MIKKVELAPPHKEIFAEPTPLGLLGLAIGCAALVPAAFGVESALTPAGFETAAIIALLFGAGAQFLAGMMNFANKNLFGGTILTAFSFNWVWNWWVFHSAAAAMRGEGIAPEHSVILAVEVISLVIFVVLTYGFGFFSKLLFFFLLTIDLLTLAKIVRGFFPATTPVMNLAVALFTVALALIALWIAFAALINPTAGRSIFKIAGPMFFAPARAPTFDWSVRNAIHAVLYEHWRENAFAPLSFDDLQREVTARIGERDIVPDLFYLNEYGSLVLTFGDGDGIRDVRLNAPGIDLYEQLAFRKYEAA